MRIDTARKRPCAGDTVRILAVDATEQAHRLQDAIAHRAFEIFESQGAIPGHEQEHWRQAETELASSRCSGQMNLDGSLWVNADAALFEPDTIEIWVAPRRLTIYGKPHVLRASAAGQEVSCGKSETIFHVIDLVCEVDPSRVTAKFDDAASLEIVLAKAEPQALQNREKRTVVA
jgi:HSP20 family molecular chaperone IbpA